MMELDPSVGADPSTEMKRLTQLTRGSRGGGGLRSSGRLSQSTRSTFAEPAPVPRRDNSSEVIQGGGRPFPDNTQTSIEMRPGDKMVGPDEVALGRSDQGSMADAYQKLLHSVALQHGGKQDAGEHITPGGFGGRVDSDAVGPGGTHQEAYDKLLHSIAMQHGGQPPTPKYSGSGPHDPRESSADWNSGKPGPAWDPKKDPVPDSGAFRNMHGSAQHKEEAGIPAPPRLPPPGSSAEDMKRYEAEHKEWDSERQYALAHSAIENRKDVKERVGAKAELTSLTSQKRVLEQELVKANAEVKKHTPWWGTSKEHESATKEKDHIQKLLDGIKTKRDKMVEKLLKGGNEGGDEGGEISNNSITEDEYNALKSGESFMYNGQRGVKP